MCTLLSSVRVTGLVIGSHWCLYVIMCGITYMKSYVCNLLSETLAMRVICVQGYSSMETVE